MQTSVIHLKDCTSYILIILYRLKESQNIYISNVPDINKFLAI